MIEQLRQQLKAMADPTTAASSKSFFKEPIKTYGVKTAEVRAMAKTSFQELKSKPKEFVFEMCEALWQTGYREESIIASYWTYALRKQFEPADFRRFERWINLYVSNWASCDDFCNQTMGAFLMQYPDYLPVLKHWAKADNRWLRRAAAVSLIVPARKGIFLDDIFNISLLQLKDKDDLVQKGYGWLLKVVSQSQPKAVYDFVMEHKRSMPRTALRYAIEKMPADLKAKAMEK